MAAGLRHRRMRETRAALSSAAMRLFSRSGFEHVTIAQIAEAAGVSKMTVTNHFPRKEDLVFDRTDEAIRSLAQALTDRRPGASALDAVREDCAARLAAHDATLGPPGREFAVIVEASRVLTSRAREIADLRERALAEAIAAETGTDDLAQRIAAAQLASVHRTVFAETSRRVLQGEARESVFEDLAGVASGLFDGLRPGLGRYLVRPFPEAR